MKRPLSLLNVGSIATLVFACSFGSFAQENLERGRQLFEHGRVAEARHVFESAVQENPQNDVAAFYLGRIFFAEEDYDRAVEWFEKAAQVDAGNSDYHLWLGRGYGNQALRASVWSRFFLARKVRQHFEKAVELDPENTAARLDLLEYYLKAPRFLGGGKEKALVQAEEIKKRDVERGREAEEMIAAAEGQKVHAKSD
jgi:tetratricopeptide (TPR) repeat protein